MFGPRKNFAQGVQGVCGTIGAVGNIGPIKGINILVARKTDNSIGFLSQENPSWNSEHKVDCQDWKNFKKYACERSARVITVPLPVESQQQLLDKLSSDSLTWGHVQNVLQEKDFLTTKNALNNLFSAYEFNESLLGPYPPKSFKDNVLSPQDSWYYDHRNGIKYMRFYSNLAWITNRKAQEANSWEEKSNLSSIETLLQQKRACKEMIAPAAAISATDAEYFETRLAQIEAQIDVCHEKIVQYAAQKKKHLDEEATYVAFLNTFAETVQQAVFESCGHAVDPENICVIYC